MQEVLLVSKELHFVYVLWIHNENILVYNLIWVNDVFVGAQSEEDAEQFTNLKDAETSENVLFELEI